ncbi:MAG: RAD55 family ATPase [Candidatus Micrarchaeota archaeon]|nr:RAD55 family ATPase [Candidatus Micrarchaeota archaeon]
MPSDLVLPTGIKGLDDILGGGLPLQSNVLLYGDPLCGKKPLLMQFVYEGLKMNIPGIFVLLDYGFDDWRGMMESSGWSIDQYEQNGLLQVVDCYSKQFDPSLEDEGIVSYVDNPSDLSDISMTISGLQEQIAQIAENHRLGFHSVSSLLETNPPDAVFRFMQFMTGKGRKTACTALYVLEKGMHDEKQVKMIEHLMDGVIEFTEDKLHVRGLMGASTAFHHYEIGPHGIIIKV